MKLSSRRLVMTAPEPRWERTSAMLHSEGKAGRVRSSALPHGGQAAEPVNGRAESVAMRGIHVASPALV